MRAPRSTRRRTIESAGDSRISLVFLFERETEHGEGFIPKIAE
jgi:hypothetical protein